MDITGGPYMLQRGQWYQRLYSVCVFQFLAQLNRRLKWAFRIKICPLSVVVVVFVVGSRELTCRPSLVCPYDRMSENFSHIHVFLQNHLANFKLTWHKAFLGKGDSSFFKWRVPHFSKGWLLRNGEMHWRNLKKIFFSRTSWPISTKLGTMHPLVKVIQVCSNEGPYLFPRGDNYVFANIHWRNLKSLFI